ncbi:LacI family DNA-binding transcriptional regulator [Devosia sp. CN2-171]|uniref:LacI family DNA-binding transcriptional regulator n=1 Tax=Devosia sp. CN2-171 TaxID=3400909 RepID=UPI003BF890D0
MQMISKRSPRAAKATMTDVAQLAGVSAATVARALYKNGYVKEETRQAVEAAVAATGYRLNSLARGLRTSRSFTLGLVVSEPQPSAFHVQTANVVQLEALKLGYTVLTLNNHGDAAMEAAGVRRFLDDRADAVIFCAAIDPANVRLIERSGIPTVQIERQVALVGGLVLPDAEQGMREAVDHLYALGHRDFAYIGGVGHFDLMEGPKSEAVEPKRERLFLESVARHGLSVPPAYVRRGAYYIDGGQRGQPGHELVKALLELRPRPTALICGSDLLAAFALQAISEAGLRVPTDISVIGYDGVLAEILTPPLSSIAQPIEELGRLAVEMAVAAIDDPNATLQPCVIPTRLLLRESTGNAPAGGP